MSRRNAYLGDDSVYYCENSAGHVFLTTPESPIPEGFQRFHATTVWEVERIWKRIDQQEKRDAERMTETMYLQRKAKLEAMKSHLATRMASSDCSNAEKDFIRESLKVLNRKEDILNSHSVYGVAFMQQKEAPLPAAVNEKVTVN